MAHYAHFKTFILLVQS